MKITVSDIPFEGIDIQGEEVVAAEDINLASAIKYDLRVDKAGAEVIINGSMRAEIGFACGRCLKEFTREVRLPLDVVYHSVGELGPEERHELKEEELETGFYVGDEIDLDGLFKEQIILSLPIKTLCSETCRGICPACGADLNEQGCSCEQKKTDPRFAVLKDYLERRKQ